MNEVSQGGQELDVTAELVQPLPGSTRTTPIVCECKATESPVDMTAWLKFLGKVLTRRLSNQQTGGCLLALRRVNGNVSGAVKDLREKDDSIEVLEGARLDLAVIRSFGLPDEQRISEALAAYSVRDSEVELICHQKTLYWMANLPEGKFTLLTAAGVPLTAAQSSELVSEIESATTSRGFVDIGLAADSARHRLLVRGVLLAKVLRAGIVNLGQEAEVAAKAGDRVDFKLLARDICDSVPGFFTDGESLRTSRSTSWTAADRVDTLVALFEGNGIPVDLIGTETWSELTASSVIEEVLRRIGWGTPPNALCDEVSRITWYSPTSLVWLIKEIHGSLANSFTQTSAENERRTHEHLAQSIIHQCANFLYNDFRRAEFQQRLHNELGLRELAVKQEIVVKGASGVLFTLPTKRRLRIARFVGGGLILVDILDGVEEPWEPPSSLAEVNGANPPRPTAPPSSPDSGLTGSRE